MELMTFEARRKLSLINRVVLVTAGKGGVGKSVVAASLAIELASRGMSVGLLDADVHGFASHLLLGREGAPVAGKRGLSPISRRGVRAMGLGFLMGDLPAPLRGGYKSSLLESLLAMTDWGPLDYLIVDTPPGTGDEILTLISLLRGRPRGFIVVATSSALSVPVVGRLIEFLRREGEGLIGLVENMAGLFTSRGIEELSERYSLRVLVRIPFDPRLEESVTSGKFPEGLSEEFSSSISRLANEVSSWEGWEVVSRRSR